MGLLEPIVELGLLSIMLLSDLLWRDGVLQLMPLVGGFGFGIYQQK